MTIAHRAVTADEIEQTTAAELYAALGSEDTPQLYGQGFRVDTDHDIAAGGGNSIDRKVVYIDRTLYQEVMDGAFAKSGLTGQQIITLWLLHEHVELCILQGDNPVDTYEPAHHRALRLEHDGLLVILGRDRAIEKIATYEEAIWPGLLRAYHRPIKKPPLDLWCGPYLDDPTPRDEEILAELRKAGVVDARKRSHYEIHYGMAKHRCRDCAMFSPDKLSQERRQLALCEAVSGLVRDNRGCDLWIKK